MIDRRLLNIFFPPGNIANLAARQLQEMPVPKKPIVSRSDVERKFLTRYFVKQVNDNSFITEVDLRQYENFKENPRFAVAKIDWKIVGKKETEISRTGIVNRGVADYNLQEVSKIDLTFKGLLRYISNYTEYWISES